MVPCLQEHPLKINSISQLVLFADDTSVIISSRNFEDFCAMSNLVLSYFISFIVHLYCYICYIGCVQLYITVYYNAHTKSQTVTVMKQFYVCVCVCVRACVQGVSRLVDITAGGDFPGLCDQKSSYKHVSDFGRLRSYDRLKLRIESNDYWQ